MRCYVFAYSVYTYYYQGNKQCWVDTMKSLILVLLFISSLPLCAQQTINIGTLPFNPPFSMQGSRQGHFFGFEISLMNEICNRIDVQCNYKKYQFGQLFNALENREIDIAIGAIIITQTRQDKYLFSLPYFMSKGCVVVIKDKYKDINELRDKNVGTIEGTLYGDVILKKFGPSVKLKTYTFPPELFSDLTSEKIDALLIDKEPAQYWIAKDGNLTILGPEITTGSGYAIMALKSQTALIEKINETLLEIQEDGTYIKLHKAFFN